jgi:hypothetical protein
MQLFNKQQRQLYGRRFVIALIRDVKQTGQQKHVDNISIEG